jgi:hypothetical protein
MLTASTIAARSSRLRPVDTSTRLASPPTPEDTRRRCRCQRYCGLRAGAHPACRDPGDRRRRAAHCRRARLAPAATTQPLRRHPHSRDIALGRRVHDGKPGGCTSCVGSGRAVHRRWRAGLGGDWTSAHRHRVGDRCRGGRALAGRRIAGPPGRSHHRATAAGWLRRVQLRRRRLHRTLRCSARDIRFRSGTGMQRCGFRPRSAISPSCPVRF